MTFSKTYLNRGGRGSHGVHARGGRGHPAGDASGGADARKSGDGAAHRQGPYSLT